MKERKGGGNKSEDLNGVRVPPNEKLFTEMSVNGNCEHNCSGDREAALPQRTSRIYWEVEGTWARNFSFSLGGGQKRY